MSNIIFPTQPHEPEVNMSSCLLFGKEKCGKTTALSQLDNCLIVDTEKGTRKLKALSMQVPETLGPVGKMNWLREVGKGLCAMEKKYDYVAVDTLSEVNDWAEWSGTFRYMQSSVGKSFNRVKDSKGIPIKGGAFLPFDDPEYASVHTLPDGNGYRWSRDEVLDIFQIFSNAASKCVFYICHLEEKFVGEAATAVAPMQLALTGKLRSILPRKVDAIGYVYNEKGALKVNFTGDESKIGGNRAAHLRGYNGPLEWNKIFI